MLVNILQSVKEWVRDWSESTFLKLSGGTLTGALNGTSATFSGNVSGDNATFSGDISGDNAIFSGDVSGSNADFSGNLDADGNINVGGNIVALSEAEVQERLTVNANDDNYGAIHFNSTYNPNGIDAVKFIGNSDQFGDEMVVGAGGMFIAGAGESAWSLHNALIDAGGNPGNEESYITADSHLYLFSHCNTITNRTQLMMYSSSDVQLHGRCGADHAVSIDTSSNNGVTTTTNIGELVFQDKNTTLAGSINAEVYGSAGRVQTKIIARNKKTDGSIVSNQLCVCTDKNGTAAYYVTNAANFRSAIGAAASSDRRLKHDITPLGEEAIRFVKDLEPCVYIINGERQVGFIAQDIAESDPWDTRMAFETKKGLDGLDDWERMPDGSSTWKLDYIRTIPPIAAALKKAMERIDQLETRVAELEMGENNA